MPSLRPLTSLRFFAAISIVLFHVLGSFGLPHPSSLGIYFGVSVEFFFLLSGFILSYKYKSIPGFKEPIRLILSRAARIWPLHIATLLLLFALTYDATNPMHDLRKVWASIFLVQSWLGDYTFGFNGNPVAWTLSVELAFYLMFPYLTKLHSLTIILITIIVSLTTVFITGFYAWRDITEPTISVGAIAIMHPGMFLVLFTSGMITARFFSSRQWILDNHVATFLEITSIFLAVLFLVYNIQIISLARILAGLKGPPAILLGNVLAVVFFLPAIWMLAVDRGKISSALSHPAWVFLGELSFAIYMCHHLLIPVVERLGIGYVAIPTYIGLVFLLSAALFIGLERPAQRFLRQRINGALSSSGPK